MDNYFLQRLRIELSNWIEDGIIDNTQKEQILKRYEVDIAPPPKKTKLNVKLPAIIISLAGILFCVGLSLFYAANWKKMAPFVKLIQVFALIILTYGSAYYFLAIKEKLIILGRILLIMGMVSFGVGIMLVAQIFHISAHPTNGLLAWAVGVIITSFVTKEKWGYYFAVGLLFIWNTWELSIYQNPNYILAIFIVIMFYLFYKAKAITGIIITCFAFLFYFYQINIYWLSKASYLHLDIALGVFALTHLPLGILLISLSRITNKNDILKIPSIIMSIIGWFYSIVPFLFLSWPINFKIDFLFFQKANQFFNIEYYAILIVSIGSLIILMKKHLDYIIPLACTGFSLLLIFLPIGEISVLMVTMHLGIVAYLFLILYTTHKRQNRTYEKGIAFAFFILFLIVKWIGFFVYGAVFDHYYFAYLIGALIFGVVLFLLNHFIKYLLSKKNIFYRQKIFNTACAFICFFIIYAASFKIEKLQYAIFDAETYVIILLFLFLSIAIGFYTFLILKSKDKLPIILSSIIFTISTIVLFITGRNVTWVAYSLIFNILLFSLTSIYIYYSTKINSILLLNFTIAGFILHIVTRYIDLFWDMLSGSVLFLILGLIGILGGWFLEKKRRKLLTQFKEAKGA